MRVQKKKLKKAGKCILSIMGLFVVIIIAAVLSITYHDSRLGEDSVYAAVPRIGSSVGIVLALFLILGECFKHFKKKERVANRLCEIKRKKVLTVFFISVGIAVSVILDTQWVDYYTLEGITSCRPFVTTEYMWKDAKRFKLEMDRHENLQFVIYMKDGKKYTYKNGWMSTAFTEKFEEHMFDYLPWLAVKMKENEVPMDVSGWDKLLDKLEYETHQDCAKSIRAEYQKS